MTENAELSPVLPKCPRCRSDRIRPSHRKDTPEKLACVVTPLQIYRCDDCRHRWWGLGKIRAVMPARRRLRILGAVGLGFALGISTALVFAR